MENFRQGEDLFMVIGGGRGHTVEEIYALPEGQRAELIDGELFMMAAPSVKHQLIVSWIGNRIFNYIADRKGSCRVFLSPIAVFLKEDRRNYLEPDIAVVYDVDKLEEDGCHGAPDWVIEIVSESSRQMDYERKLEAYRETGVREYWLIDPETESVAVYDFAHGTEAREYRFTDAVRSGLYEELSIVFSELADYMDTVGRKG